MGGGVDDPINHVEYWSNRDDTRFVYEMNESGAEYPLSKDGCTFVLSTSDGVDIPCIPYHLIHKVKKNAVNIDLVVLKVSLVINSFVVTSINESNQVELYNHFFIESREGALEKLLTCLI